MMQNIAKPRVTKTKQERKTGPSIGGFPKKTAEAKIDTVPGSTQDQPGEHRREILHPQRQLATSPLPNRNFFI